MKRLSIIAVLISASVAFGQTESNVVVVLDASGSMAHSIRGSKITKMTAAKDALRIVLSQVEDGTNIGLLVFGSEEGWEYELAPKNTVEINKAIERIRTGGGTPLGKFMKAGADALLEQRDKQFGYGSYRLLVVTDGEASDRNLVDKYTPDIVSRGITVDVIGVAMGSEHTLANQVHSYRSANDPEALQIAIKEVFAEVGADEKTDSGEDPYEVIAPLPDSVCQAMISAFGESGNHPIGDKPLTPVPSGASIAVPSGGFGLTYIGIFVVGILLIGGIVVTRR